MLRKILPMTRGYRLSSILAAVTVLGEVVLEVYIPFLMADIIDIGIANGDVDFIVKRGLLVLLMALLALACGMLSAGLAVKSSAGFAANLRKSLFDKLQDFAFSNVDKFSTGSLLTRLTTDVSNVQMSYQMIIRICIRAPGMLVMATVMAVRISPNLSVVFAVAIPLLATVLGVLAVITFPRFQRMLKMFDDMNNGVQENLTAIRVVKAFVREKDESDKFIDKAETVRNAQIKAEKGLVVIMPFAQFVMYLSMITVLYLGGVDMIQGSLEAGELMSFISYVTQILSSLLMISMIFVNLVLTKASLMRITEVLDENPAIYDAYGVDRELRLKDGSIDFNDVCFSYSGDADNLTLSHIDLHIDSGETIGIIGGTGSSKSTLAMLIPRLYDVISGSVMAGGTDVREYSIDALRGDVSMVLQKNVLFTGTIRENLRWGDPEASDEDIEQACKNAAAHDFIMSFPDGYDTVLGQGGVNVSGGQKQRLCIARALLKKPKIVIMDDSTSAVDTATDASIRKALREKLADTTTLIIAQRITSVMDADRIIVMDDGRVSAFGTHDELMRDSAIYREVYESQQKGVA